MNKKTALLVIAIAVAIPLSGIFAQNAEAVKPTSEEIAQRKVDNQAKREEIQTRREELRTEREELQAQRKTNREQWCKNVETRIDTRINRYQNNQDALNKVYAHMYTRLTKLVVTLESKSVDVTNLRADLTQLASLTNKLATDYANFITELSGTKSNTCGQSDGEFVKQLGEARSIIPTIKEDRQAIKTFLQTTLRPHLQEARKQLEALNPTDADEDADTQENEAEDADEPKDTTDNSSDKTL